MQSALPSRQQSKFWPCGAGKQCNHNIQQFEGMFVMGWQKVREPASGAHR